MDYDALEKRLREPPFGTETSERNLMMAAADAIADLRARNEALVEAADNLVNTGDEHDSWCSVGALYNCTCDMKPAKDAMRLIIAANREG